MLIWLWLSLSMLSSEELKSIPGAVEAKGSRIVACEIFFMDWDTVYITPMSLALIREQPVVYGKAAMRWDAAQSLYERLLLFMHANVGGECEPGDYRLLIDFVRSDGSTVSFVATKYCLFDLNHTMQARIDDAFREEFKIPFRGSPEPVAGKKRKKRPR